ncbi:hypothetical protein [Marinagarivorans algicola]|uniref:hypothetical protein n=1 Tax=Marinagarivorans algicola TaxID=1513270 RepID=UPI003735F8BE
MNCANGRDTPGDTKAMKKLLLIALSTSLAMGAHAANDKKFHVGGGVSAWKLAADSNVVRGQFNLTTVEAVGSYSIFPWLLVDGKIGTGVENEKATFQSSSILYPIADIVTEAGVAGDPTATPPVEAVAEVKEAAVGKMFYQQPIKANVNYYTSVHLKPQIKNDTAAFYGLIGASFLDIEYKVGNSRSRQASYLGTIGQPNEIELWNNGSWVDAADSDTISQTGAYLSFGLGVSFFFDRWTLNTEWKSIADSDKLGDTGLAFKTSNLSMSVTYSLF